MTAGGTVKMTPVAILAASLLLAACGGGAKPDASSTSTSPSTSTPAPTVSVSSTTAPTIDPNIPAAARAHTPAGAEAFVRYFYSQLNIAWSKPQAGLISGLSAKTCKTCANFEQEAQKSVSNSERVIGQSIILANVSTSDATNPAKMIILAIGYQPQTIVVDAKGKTVQTLKREAVRTLVTLLWESVGWRVSEIQSVA